MTRSRRRKLERLSAKGRARSMLKGVPLASVILAGLPPAFAQTESSGLQEVVVTAQKREENLQNVPLSITALGTAKLEEMQVKEFTDYAKLLPSVSYQSYGPGATSVYMRGVASGENSNHSGPLPSVGIYLDEQPITTIQGALDVHIYDIARVEALAGPQGTLYGASSQAGTIRIITNKPDPSAFKSSYDLQMETVESGDPGYLGEGFVNVPLADRAAVRIVGWARHDGGYIDNVAGTRTYPSWAAFQQANGTGTGTVSNASIAKDNYNDINTYGGRAALKIDLNDNWTVSPTVMGQAQKSNGTFGYDPRVGDLKVTHFKPEYARDNWWQAALTVEGKFSNLDLVYAGAHLKRDIHSSSDYTDYAYFYDVNYGSGAYFYNDVGDIIDPSQYFVGNDGFFKDSHELRISSDPTRRFRFVAGLFWQRQEHQIEQRYKVDGIATAISVTGWPDTIWLTEQVRVDRDKAAFGEVTYDITPKLSATAGIRFFKAHNTLQGFFGYGLGFSGSTGEAGCDPNPANWVTFHGAPCVNLDKGVRESGNTPRFNLTYHIDDGKLVYATYSEGFRPGGINRRGSLPPYKADYLKNYEFGWKTTWMNNRLRVNGAVFWLDWNDIQFSYLGLNGLTEIKNANKARVRGIESEINWAVTQGFSLTGALAYTDAELAENYCGTTDPVTGAPITNCANPLAPDGTRLPVAPKFKGNITGRYEFPVQTFSAHVQASLIYQSSVYSDLRLPDRLLMGQQPAYGLTDLSAGFGRDSYNIELYVHNAFDRRTQTYRTTECGIYGYADPPQPLCGQEPYIIPDTPRTIGLRFGQRF